jgi:translocation and assembly module TamB
VRGRVLKSLRRWLAFAFLFSVLLLGTVAMLLNTESGSRFVVNRIAAAVPGSLYVDGVEGTLWRTLRLRVLNYRNEQIDLNSTDVQISINWPRALSGSLAMRQLGAGDIVIRILAPAVDSPSQPDFEMVILPLGISIEETSIASLLVSAGTSNLEIEQIEFTDASAHESSVAVRELSIGDISFQNLAPAVDSPSPLNIEMAPLPLIISIDEASVSSVNLSGSASNLQIGQIEFTDASATESRLKFGLLAAVYADTEFVLTDAETNLTGDVPVTSELGWRRTDGAWSGDGSVKGSLAELEVSHLLTSPYAVTTTGDIRLIDRIDPEFDLRFTSPRYVIADVELTNGDVNIAGTTGNYETAFSVSVAEPRIPDLSITGNAAGNTEGLRNANLDVQSEYGLVAVAGSIGWLPELTASVSMNVREFDPSKFVDTPEGRLGARIQFELAGIDDWHLTINEVAGTLGEDELQADGTLTLTPGLIECRSCSAILGSNRVSADGSYSDELVAMSVNIDAPSLETFWPEIDKYLVASGRFDGTPSEIDADINLTYGDFGTISAAANVARTDTGFAGSVSRAVIEEPHTGRWVLGTPLVFRTGPESIEIDSHRWLPPSGRLLVSRVSASPEQIAIVASLSGLPLATANSFLPPKYQLDGSAEAEIDVTRSAGEWLGSVHWKQADTVLRVSLPGGEIDNLRIPTATVDGTLADGSAHFKSLVRIDPGISLNTTVNIESLFNDPQLDARLRLDGESWDWITSIVPDLENFGGDISADISADGPLTSPTLTGSASWQGGSADIPALNVPLTNADVVITGAADGTATVSGSAMLGDGTVDIDGRFADLTQSTRRLELTLTGDAAEFVNWPEYHLWATPDMRIVGALGGWDAQGELEIPKAEIVVRELPENAVAMSPDIRTTETDLSTSKSAARYSGEARLRFGEDVHISAFGLNTHINGELIVRKSPDRELRGEGRVELVDGEFTAYGQRLTIEQGTLTFTGPLDDPIVDVRATRTIEGFDQTVVAGIQLNGRAQNLNSSVFSDPEMSEADALSYLLIGRPLAEATNTEGGDLSTAAVGLGLRQASRVTQQVGQSIGLDQLSVIGDGGDATALVAGKQINQRLYARYAYGVFSRVGMIMLRYRLSERLSLEAGAGETQSIDILYSVEKE